jgi:pimeloyl-ACP methyl ester carboxylesterase
MTCIQSLRPRSRTFLVVAYLHARVKSAFVFRSAVGALVVMSTFASAPRSVNAQLLYDHTTFVHGFASGPGIWIQQYPDLGTTPVKYLSKSVVIGTPGFANLDSTARFSAQVGNLASFLSPAGQHVIIAHSMGSLVSRDMYIDYPALRPQIKGIVAIAAPHQGVPLADNALVVRAFFADVQRRIVGAIPGILVETAVAGWLISYAGPEGVTGGLFLFAAAAGYFLHPNQTLDLTSLYALTAIPALQDIRTTSPTIDSLNREFDDSQVQRANLYGTIPAKNAVIRVLYSANNDDAHFATGVANYNKAIALFKSCKYVNYATIYSWYSGRNCGFAVKVLRRIDERWVRYVNGTDAYGNPRVIPFDGIVPNERSRYPTSNGVSFDKVVPGVNHISIYKTQIGLDQVVAGMRAIGMQPAAPPPPVGPVTISGPASFGTMCGGEWTAAVIGGTAPFGYVWTAAGNTFYTGASNVFDWKPPAAGTYTIQVQVTDSKGITGSASKSVTSSTRGFC